MKYLIGLVIGLALKGWLRKCDLLKKGARTLCG